MTETKEFKKREREFTALFQIVKREDGLNELSGEEFIQAKHRLVDAIFKFEKDPNDLNIDMLFDYIKAEYSEATLERFKREAGVSQK